MQERYAMDSVDLTVNRLPVPTWNRLKMNESKVTVSLADGGCKPVISLQGNICLRQSDCSDSAGCCRIAGACPVHGDGFSDIETGMGAAVSGLGTPSVLQVIAECDEKGVASLNFDYADGSSKYNLIEIEAKPKSDITVYMTYIASANAGGTASVQTKIIAGEGAKVRLVQIQLLGKNFLHLNDVGAELKKDSSLDVVQLQLGASKIYNGAKAKLAGDSSNFSCSVGYYGREGQHLDMNFVADHYGKKSTSFMTGDGVLQQGAFKIYRGTINFKRGCVDAEGEEQEKVLLLSDDVVNQSIPLILCAEEQVQGNHGASIGRLDESLLFYLCSRGFDERQATDMMAKASIEALLHKVQDEKIVQVVERYLEGVTVDAR
ncbi:MAG: SufD family Fe-S cluster assembly protein [Acidaminococcaceae bacterium]|nr:SufD family Fe-S cluster assembly protein [Acidaminococcaceae bacterium]